MNLLNYFLADTPPGAVLTPAMMTEACQTLKRNRERYLRHRPTSGMVNLLSELGGNWLDPEYPFRKLALEEGPSNTGFSRATLSRGLDSFFGQLTGENLQGLLLQELGHTRRLDEIVATSSEEKSGRSAFARAPALLVHLASGGIPSSTWMNMALGVLLRSAQLVKCATGSAFLPRLFAHSLYQAEPKLGACLEIAEWTGGNLALESALFAEADCLTVTGSDETLSAIKHRLTPQTRFVGYGHRVSFGYVTHEMFTGFSGRKIIAGAAADVIAWDQLGCLSPHVFYVEHGGTRAAEQFAHSLAEELEKREAAEPRGPVCVETSAAIARRRAFYEVRAGNSSETRCWFSPNSTAWSVVYEDDPRFQVSCLNRFIYVKAVKDLGEALQGADAVRQRISTVGLAAAPEQAERLANELARWGATRICPIGQMQNPPLSWRHDGRLSLSDLVTWVDWEQR